MCRLAFKARFDTAANAAGMLVDMQPASRVAEDQREHGENRGDFLPIGHTRLDWRIEQYATILAALAMAVQNTYARWAAIVRFLHESFTETPRQASPRRSLVPGHFRMIGGQLG